MLVSSWSGFYGCDSATKTEAEKELTKSCDPVFFSPLVAVQTGPTNSKDLSVFE